MTFIHRWGQSVCIAELGGCVCKPTGPERSGGGSVSCSSESNIQGTYIIVVSLNYFPCVSTILISSDVSQSGRHIFSPNHVYSSLASPTLAQRPRLAMEATLTTTIIAHVLAGLDLASRVAAMRLEPAPPALHRC